MHASSAQGATTKTLGKELAKRIAKLRIHVMNKWQELNSFLLSLPQDGVGEGERHGQASRAVSFIYEPNKPNTTFKP